MQNSRPGFRSLVNARPAARRHRLLIHTAPAAAVVLLGLAPLERAAAAEDIHVDFAAPVSTLHPLAISMDESTYGRFGTNLTVDQTQQQRLTALGSRMMRVDLEYEIPGDSASRIICGASGCAADVSGDGWITTIKSLGAVPTIIVPVHTATAASDAAAMVRHFNITTNNSVRRWIIGNEPDNSGSSSAMNATTYSNTFNVIYDAMKRVDASIEIGGPATAYYNTSFLDTFLVLSGGRVDFVDFHTYGQGGSTVKTPQVLLSETNRYETYINDLRNRIAARAPTRTAEIEIEVGEWNLDWDSDPKLFEHFNTVWSASVLGHILRAGGISMAFADKNGSLGALYEYTIPGYPGRVDDLMPIYHGISMYTGAQRFRRFGESMVSTSTSLGDVDVYASANPKNVILINRNAATSYTASVRLTGMSSGTAEVWIKDPSVPVLNPPARRSDVTITSGVTTVSLPAYSVVTLVISDGTPTPPPPSGEEFQESGGQVVLEAEHHGQRIDRNGKSWTFETSQPGFAGGGFLRALPNTGTNLNTGYVTGSPELVYRVNFSSPGTYHVWVRGYGSNGSDDSLHAGLDGAGPASADRITGFPASWAWSRTTMDNNLPATLQINSPGVHTIHLWMREDGFRLDRVLLRTDSSSTAPSGSGPAESPRGP